MVDWFTINIIIVGVLGVILGSLIGVLRYPKKTTMYLMFAFAAGVMLAVSFLELLPEAVDESGVVIALIGFFVGITLFYLIDKLFLHKPTLIVSRKDKSLKKTAWLLIIALAVHNFPEGMALGIASISEATTAIIIALAIAIHNLPEGIVASAPYYHATKKRMRAFLLGSMTAIPLIIGFLFADFLFSLLPEVAIGFVFALTAGIMTYISVSELIPNAKETTNKLWGRPAVIAFVSGIFLIVLLEIVFLGGVL